MKIDLHFQFSCRIAEFWSGRADCRATLCESSRPCASTRRTSTWLCRLSRMPSGRDNRAGKGFLGVSHGLEIESHLIGNLQTVRRNEKKYENVSYLIFAYYASLIFCVSWRHAVYKQPFRYEDSDRTIEMYLDKHIMPFILIQGWFSLAYSKPQTKWLLIFNLGLFPKKLVEMME